MRLLSVIEQGDGQATEQLLPLIYDELHRLAAELVARERPEQTLQAMALVNEAYLRLVEPTQTQHWHGRAHFFAAAAEAMRRILVENCAVETRPKTRRGVASNADDEFGWLVLGVIVW